MYIGGLDRIEDIEERAGQIRNIDFVGCIHSVNINGRNMNVTSPISSRGITDTCPRVESPCNANNPCGDGECIDRWDRVECRCSEGYLAPDCGSSLQPVSLDGDSFVDFKIGEKHRRQQLAVDDPGLSRWKRQLKMKSKSISFKFRTNEEDGLLLYSASNQDYTILWY